MVLIKSMNYSGVTILFKGVAGLSKARSIFSSFFAIFVSVFLYNVNFLHIKQNFESTYLYRRLIISNMDSSRSDSWRRVLDNLIKYPLGGKGFELKHGYAHNLWLDTAYESGILPLILLLFFTLSSLMAVKVFLKGKHPIDIKLIVLCILSAFFVIFMLEPVLQGLTSFFMFFCLVIGIIFKVNYLDSQKTNDKTN